MNSGYVPEIVMAATLFLVLVGFGFKISAVPFHFWAPDVYEGAPTPVAGFLSTASKAAGFAVLMRVLSVIFPAVTPVWSLIISILAAASMMLGNFLALAQKNIKRLLAYSSIAQAGYMLIGVAAGNSLGLSGASYYLLAYMLTNIAAFGIIHIVGKSTGSDEISAYAGLNRRSPGLALAMLIALLSLAGIPPFAGFIGKILVFAAAMQADLIWLVILGVLNSIVALYYYLVIMKTMYSLPAASEKRILVNPAWKAALMLCIVGILLLGTILFGYGYGWTNLASLAFLTY
jgi:NADH-quinone oxidoreductase subunit N